jgi:hypothetical protein
VLVLTNGVNQNAFLSGRNLPDVHVMPYGDVSTYHILWSELVVIEEGALTGEPAGTAGAGRQSREETAAAESKPAARKPAPKREAKAKASPKAGTSRKSERKTAAKKAAKKKGK